MSSTTIEYCPSPTLAAIDMAAARAVESAREASVDAEPKARRFEAFDRVIGSPHSYERGFILTAAIIALALIAGTLFIDVNPILAVVAPALVVMLITLQKTDAPVDGANAPPVVRMLVRRSMGRPILALIAAPGLTRWMSGVFTDSQRAALWTAWGAMLVGVAALFV